MHEGDLSYTRNDVLQKYINNTITWKQIVNGFGDCIVWFLWFLGFVVLVHYWREDHIQNSMVFNHFVRKLEDF